MIGGGRSMLEEGCAVVCAVALQPDAGMNMDVSGMRDDCVRQQ